jgi:hypothetical protein
VVESRRNQDGVGTFVVLHQPHGISSPKSVTNRKRDITGGIQFWVYVLVCISRLL